MSNALFNSLNACELSVARGVADSSAKNRTVAFVGRVLRAAVLPAIGLSVFLASWHVGAQWIAKPILLPGPLDVLNAYQQILADGTLATDVLASLQRVFTGYLIAATLGVFLAMLLAISIGARALALPVLSVLRPIPPIAWIPLAILWFGIGDAPSYFITAIASFFPVFLNSLSGGVSVNEHHSQAARCLGASRLAVLWHVVLPSAAPSIWTGLKIGLGQAWMAVVTAELIAAHSGLGYMIQINRLNLETPVVLAGMLTIGILGAVMAFTLSVLERRLLPWRTIK